MEIKHRSQIDFRCIYLYLKNKTRQMCNDVLKMKPKYMTENMWWPTPFQVQEWLAHLKLKFIVFSNDLVCAIGHMARKSHHQPTTKAHQI